MERIAGANYEPVTRFLFVIKGRYLKLNVTTKFFTNVLWRTSTMVVRIKENTGKSFSFVDMTFNGGIGGAIC